MLQLQKADFCTCKHLTKHLTHSAGPAKTREGLNDVDFEIILSVLLPKMSCCLLVTATCSTKDVMPFNLHAKTIKKKEKKKSGETASPT